MLLTITHSTLMTFLLSSAGTVITFWLSTIAVRKLIHLTHIHLTISHWKREYKRQANSSGGFDIAKFNKKRSEAIRAVQEIGR